LVSDSEQAVPSFALWQVPQLILQALPFLSLPLLLLDHHLIKSFPPFLGDHTLIFLLCIRFMNLAGTVLAF
jgi:hypothetical protein